MEEINIVDLFNIIKKNVGLIISCILVALTLSFIFTFYVVTPQYNATTQILVNQNKANGEIQQGDIATDLQLINTYKDIIKGPIILDKVVDTLDLNIAYDQLSKKINFSNQSESQVFSLTVTDENPETAAEIANTTSKVFQGNIDGIMNVDNVAIISEAVVNSEAVSPNKTLNLSVAAFIGLLIGVALSFILEMLDRTVKDEKFIAEELGWTILGRVSDVTEKQIATNEEIPHKTSEVLRH